MRNYVDKIYTDDLNSIQNMSHVEKIFDNKEIVLVIPNDNYTIEYDITNQNRITDTLKITYDERKFYLLIHRVENDPVIKKYQLDSGFVYFILHFVDDELIDLGGISIDTYETYYFQKKDFNTYAGGKPRILQAPIIALYAPGLYVKGLRELGYEADYMVNHVGENRRFIEYEPDFDLDLKGNTTEVCRARIVEFMIYALKHYDIMHLHSNCSLLIGADRLWNRNSDMNYLKKMGKKIVSSYWGLCDMTIRNEYDGYGWVSECNVCKKIRPLLCENEEYNNAIKVTRKCSDAFLSNGRGVLTNTSISWVDNPIEVDKYNPDIYLNIPEEFKLEPTNNIRIYHSFGNMEKREDVKGSQFVKNAVEQLQKEGYPVELLFFYNVDHKVLKYYQVQADIVVDQLFAGWHGSTGVECLALGLPVITYVNPDVKTYVEQKLGRDIPLVSATPENIYVLLKDMINNIEEYKKIGTEARKYAEKYHDYKIVARKLADIYEKLGVKNVYKE